MDARGAADRLSAASLAAGDPTGWFEQLYVAAAAGDAVVPWDRGAPHPLLAEWTEATALSGDGRRALVVGAGLGGDAEHLAALGFDTVAFDISPTAVELARSRNPGSNVAYTAADLFTPPSQWLRAFDFVFESLTVQSLPEPMHADAIAQVAGFVAPGGTLLVIATARADEAAPVEGPPWPLTGAEVEAFAAGGLKTERIERITEEGAPPRWRAKFRA